MKNVTLITGASSGIGWELAKLFARDGHDLVLVARNEAKLNALAQDMQTKHHIQTKVIPADLGDPGASEMIMRELQREGIVVDILVNNAGTQVYGDFAEADWQTLLNLIQVNITSLTYLTHLLLPGMIERGQGKILNLGSTGSFFPGPLNAVYCATKAYVLSFSQAIAAETQGKHITVTTLCPGATQTDFANRHGLQNVRLFKNAMKADKVAEVGYKALMKGKRMTVPGWMNKIMAYTASPFMPATPTGVLSRLGKWLMAQG